MLPRQFQPKLAEMVLPFYKVTDVPFLQKNGPMTRLGREHYVNVLKMGWSHNHILPRFWVNRKMDIIGMFQFMLTTVVRMNTCYNGGILG